jgi:hypothetical protein
VLEDFRDGRVGGEAFRDAVGHVVEKAMLQELVSGVETEADQSFHGLFELFL